MAPEMLQRMSQLLQEQEGARDSTPVPLRTSSMAPPTPVTAYRPPSDRACLAHEAPPEVGPSETAGSVTPTEAVKDGTPHGDAEARTTEAVAGCRTPLEMPSPRKLQLGKDSGGTQSPASAGKEGPASGGIPRRRRQRRQEDALSDEAASPLVAEARPSAVSSDAAHEAMPSTFSSDAAHGAMPSAVLSNAAHGHSGLERLVSKILEGPHPEASHVKRSVAHLERSAAHLERSAAHPEGSEGFWAHPHGGFWGGLAADGGTPPAASQLLAAPPAAPLNTLEPHSPEGCVLPVESRPSSPRSPRGGRQSAASAEAHATRRAIDFRSPDLRSPAAADEDAPADVAFATAEATALRRGSPERTETQSRTQSRTKTRTNPHVAK